MFDKGYAGSGLSVRLTAVDGVGGRLDEIAGGAGKQPGVRPRDGSDARRGRG